MDQRVTRGSVGGLELHGQGPEAALGGAFKGLAVLQQRAVQVEADVGLETLGEALQHLCRVGGGGGESRGRKRRGRDSEVAQKEMRD